MFARVMQNPTACDPPTMLGIACQTVFKNRPDVAAESCRVLNMLLANLVGDPTSDKFRTIRDLRYCALIYDKSLF